MKNYFFEPFDVIIFPVIDWYYRFQRPQHIASLLAIHGRRVFYLRTYFSQGTTPVCQPLRNDLPIVDVQLGLLDQKNLVADQMDEISKNLFLDQFNILRENEGISKAVCIVDLPFWSPLVLELQKLFDWKVIYDSMDHLGGFSNVTSYMLESEEELVKKSDIVLTTSHILLNEKSQLNKNCLLIPNGTEFDHFNYSPEKFPGELADIKRPIVGYYGAMSDWLDTELIYNLAAVRPNWSFVLIGRVETADVSRLKDMSNVLLLGEKPYELLPAYLHCFNVGIIPFKKTQLTEATNPVKLFEYLSAGKSVVATDLNELRYYKDHVRLASSTDEWLDAIEIAINDYEPIQVEKRLRFARQNTWGDRIFLVEDAIQQVSLEKEDDLAPFPMILPKENLVFSRLLTQYAGIDYWCLVYEKNSIIYKQASFDLAGREARFLSQFSSGYFPRLLDVYTKGDYSVISYNKIQGQSLRDAIPTINSSVNNLYNFIQDCLNVLLELKEKGVTHRNIRRDTILIHAAKPVLYDFGWAISAQDLYFTPAGLGGQERLLNGRFSDVYSMGKILEYVNRIHFGAFDWVISLMTAKDELLRINDIKVLKTLFQSALLIALEESI